LQGDIALEKILEIQGDKSVYILLNFKSNRIAVFLTLKEAVSRYVLLNKYKNIPSYEMEIHSITVSADRKLTTYRVNDSTIWQVAFDNAEEIKRLATVEEL